MGEIIIKVPGDVKEVIEINTFSERIINEIRKLTKEKEEKLKILEEITQKYQGKLDVPEVSEDELYK